jgi:glycosyltransferase involved in cell wall biosynthesis
MITIFTPTYNRAHLIGNLYESLLKQSNKEFEWLIVDDGSVDNTQELIHLFIAESNICIHYIKQENGGKHRAINRGVQEAEGELFFIVDSDDILPANAIERIFFFYEKIKDDLWIGGICGRKSFFDGEIVGSVGFNSMLSDSLSIRYKENIMGDLAEIFKTSVLKEFPFPEYKGEKFCPEVLVWNRIAQKYQLLFFNESIYFCEYLKDGLTAQIVKIRMNSPMSSMDTYAELSTYDIPFTQKIKAMINFWRFAYCSDMSIANKIHKIGFGSLIFAVLGFLYHLKDKYLSK